MICHCYYQVFTVDKLANVKAQLDCQRLSVFGAVTVFALVFIKIIIHLSRYIMYIVHFFIQMQSIILLTIMALIVFMICE